MGTRRILLRALGNLRGNWPTMQQAVSAHDTFWDFALLMPETTHTLM
jgi:catalase